MIYKIGTVEEMSLLPISIPKCAQEELYITLTTLDSEYGKHRNYLVDDGGYALILESASDLTAFKDIVDYEAHPCEWATKHASYLSALYIISNVYAIMTFMPISIAPDVIKKELED